MHASVNVFTLPPASAPAGAPTPAPAFVVEASSHDGLRAAARAQLAASGRRVRALSFTPAGLVAYVEAGA